MTGLNIFDINNVFDMWKKWVIKEYVNKIHTYILKRVENVLAGHVPKYKLCISSL